MLILILDRREDLLVTHLLIVIFTCPMAAINCRMLNSTKSGAYSMANPPTKDCIRVIINTGFLKINDIITFICEALLDLTCPSVKLYDEN